MIFNQDATNYMDAIYGSLCHVGLPLHIQYSRPLRCMFPPASASLQSTPVVHAVMFRRVQLTQPSAGVIHSRPPQSLQSSKKNHSIGLSPQRFPV